MCLGRAKYTHKKINVNKTLWMKEKIGSGKRGKIEDEGKGQFRE